VNSNVSCTAVGEEEEEEEVITDLIKGAGVDRGRLIHGNVLTHHEGIKSHTLLI
jgi:hypothetical protein